MGGSAYFTRTTCAARDTVNASKDSEMIQGKKNSGFFQKPVFMLVSANYLEMTRIISQSLLL
jgi:hypothetical protein